MKTARLLAHPVFGRLVSSLQNPPPWWPLLLMMALGFALGWPARGILTPEKFQPPTIRIPNQ